MAQTLDDVDDLDGHGWERIELSLLVTSRTVRRAYDTRLSPLGVNLTEATLLANVRRFGPITQTQLAELLAMGRASTGSTVEALRERGLLTRDPDPADRRVWLVSLTPQGEALVSEVAVVDAKLRAELRDGLTKAERRRLVEMLDRIQANLAVVADH